jgi:hypothetical protein
MIFKNLEYTVVFTPEYYFTNYEKLLLPFDFITWILVLNVIVLTFLFFITLNNLSNFIYKYCLGNESKVDSINIIGIVFGISMLRSPRKNFLRITLSIFIIFCLIMRTAYQGVFFKMMTNDMKPKAPETIDELNEREYTIFGIEGEKFGVSNLFKR